MCDDTFCVSVRFWRVISTHQAVWDLVTPSQERSEVTAAHYCHLSCRNCSASPVSSPPCLHTCAMTQVGHMPLMDCAEMRINTTFMVVKKMMRCIRKKAWGKSVLHVPPCASLCMEIAGGALSLLSGLSISLCQPCFFSQVLKGWFTHLLITVLFQLCVLEELYCYVKKVRKSNRKAWSKYHLSIYINLYTVFQDS